LTRAAALTCRRIGPQAPPRRRGWHALVGHLQSSGAEASLFGSLVRPPAYPRSPCVAALVRRWTKSTSNRQSIVSQLYNQVQTSFPECDCLTSFPEKEVDRSSSLHTAPHRALRIAARPIHSRRRLALHEAARLAGRRNLVAAIHDQAGEAQTARSLFWARILHTTTV